MKRVRWAWDLNDFYVRIVRHMLASNDEASLLETGSGKPAEAALMVRRYELAAMEVWDEYALLEAAAVAGNDLAGESPERLKRKIALAVKSNSAPEYMPPPAGIQLLYRLGVLVDNELEETVSRFSKMGRYDGDDAPQAAPAGPRVRQHPTTKNVCDEAAPTAQDAPEVSGQAKSWQEHAREIGDMLFDNDTNAVPAVRDSLIRMKNGNAVGGYAVRVMDEMAQRKIHGPRGVIANASTIAREALSGQKWWAKKLK